MSKRNKQEPKRESGGFTGSGLAFALGAVAALVVQRFWRQIVRGTVTGAVRAQRRIRELSAEVMEDVEDAWAEESENAEDAGTAGAEADRSSPPR